MSEDTHADSVAEASAFGQRLRSARREAGITQKHLAQRMHVTIRAVQYWEAGHAMPTLKVARIAAAIGCSPHWLRTGTTKDETIPRAAATRRKAHDLREAVDLTLAQSTALLATHETDEYADTPTRAASWRRLAHHQRTRASRLDQTARHLDTQGDPERATLARDLATILRTLADHDDRQADYEETHPRTS